MQEKVWAILSKITDYEDEKFYLTRFSRAGEQLKSVGIHCNPYQSNSPSQSLSVQITGVFTLLSHI